MAETKIINTITNTTVTDAIIEILTIYDGSDLPNALLAFIAELIGTLGGVSFIEGDLVIDMKNNPSEIDFQLDSNGNLIVVGEDADKYSLDSNGNLIYTY